MDFPAGELPKQERIDGPEQKVRILLDSRYIVPDPLDLGSGEVRVKYQTGLLLDERFQSFFLQFIDDLRSLS